MGGSPQGFRRLGEEPIHRGHLITLSRVDVEGPDGERFQREVVRHPGAVSVIPLDGEGRVTLVRQYRAAVDQTVLEAPAGTCDVAGEQPEETARRELAEEVGLRAEAVTLLARIYNSPGYTDQLTHIFLATGLTPGATDRGGAEERWMTTERVHLDDVPGMIDRGELLDATTLVGLGILVAGGRGAGPSS